MAKDIEGTKIPLQLHNIPTCEQGRLGQTLTHLGKEGISQKPITERPPLYLRQVQ
jgi:hypothetical protein